jgi:molecular chaperone HscC
LLSEFRAARSKLRRTSLQKFIAIHNDRSFGVGIMLVGIDLGTTNSLIGFWRDGAVTLVPNSLGHVLTPSVVGAGDNGEMLVGYAARERLATHPRLTAAAFKRHMGTDRIRFVGEKGFRAEELSALVLRSLKADAEAALGEHVEEAIITVPAYFNDAQRKATKVAGELAGLRVERLLTEPTAAALSHGLGGQHAEDEKMILVVDLGGGTFDVSILQCGDGLMEVRATAGDSRLGGEDFVDAVVDAFMTGPGRAAGVPPIDHDGPALVHGAIRRQAEVVKRTLSEAESATLEIVHEGRPVSWTLTREMLERLAEPILVRLRAPIERALRDARLDPDALSHVVMAGGASRMPMFRRLIARLFRRLPMPDLNPDEAVARGAAVRAGLQMRGAGLEEVVLTDVAPFTLGTQVVRRAGDGGTMGGFFHPLIERNTVIPASRAARFYPVDGNARSLGIDAYQGESHLVKDNILLGMLEVPLPPPPAGEEGVDVRFTYDASGLLEVDATVVSTGRTHSLVIEGNPGVLSPTEIGRRLAALAKLKVLPRDETANVAIVARARRLYEERLGNERRQIGDWLTEFMMLLDTQDPDAIERGRGTLAERLDMVDDKFFL